MPVMTQTEMQTLVKGSSIMDDRSMDILDGFMTQIAVAALGEDKGPLRVLVNVYAEQLEAEMANVTFLRDESRIAAVEHIEWLRSL